MTTLEVDVVRLTECLVSPGGRAFDAEEGELALVVLGDELAAVIVAQLQAHKTECWCSREHSAGAQRPPTRMPSERNGSW